MAFRGKPAARHRVADDVFETLARAILSGELAPDAPLPTQRELARDLDVSALVVRQAIHRLEDLGLVRVRQGSPTIVLDPAKAVDIRLVQLQFELVDPDTAFAIAAWENQALFVVPLLALAERRITEAEVASLRALIAAARTDTGPDLARRFRIDFWRTVARASRNELFQQQSRWWSSLVAELDKRGGAARVPGTKLDLDLFARLTDALAAHRGAAQIHLEAIRPLFEWMESSLAKTKPKT